MALTNVNETEAQSLHEGTAQVWRLIVDPAKGTSISYFNDVYIYPGPDMPLHSHDEEEVFYFLDGKGVVEMEGEYYPVGPGDIIYIPSRAMHATRCAGAFPLRLVCVGCHPAEIPAAYADRVPTLAGRSDY